jgi:hypothetical protein
LNRTIAFKEVIPIRQTLGLSLSLTQEATVQDWWLAYAAAAQLRATNKTFSTLTGSSLTEEQETALHEVSLARIDAQLSVEAREFATNQSKTSFGILTGGGAATAKDAVYNHAHTKDTISVASRLIDEAASIAPTAITAGEIMALLFKARDLLRRTSVALAEDSVAAYHADADKAVINAPWDTLFAKNDKNFVSEAVAKITKFGHGQPEFKVDEAIKAGLPEHFAALETATAKLFNTIQKLPAELVAAQIGKRQTLHETYPHFPVDGATAPSL